MRLTKKQLSPDFRGAIAKTVVIKQYSHGAIMTAYPDMSGVKPSPKQKACRKSFKAAVAYASAINNDPVQKASYAAKLPEGTSVYHYALREYMYQKRPKK